MNDCEISGGTAQVLVDADLILYKAGYASQRTNWAIWHDEASYLSGEPYVEEFEYKAQATSELCNRFKSDHPCGYIGSLIYPDPWETALDCVHAIKAKIIRTLDTNTMYSYYIFKCFFSCPSQDNFRHDTYNNFKSLDDSLNIPGYKQNRDATKPHWFYEIKQFIQSDPGFCQYVEQGIDNEADDLIGLAMSKDYFNSGTIIASIDKDLDTLPGYHVNWDKYIFYTIDDNLSIYNFYRQVLMGDRIDNIIGLRGIGPVRADKILGEAYRRQFSGDPKEDISIEDLWHTVCIREYAALANSDDKAKQKPFLDWLNLNCNLLWLQRQGRCEWGRDEYTFRE